MAELKSLNGCFQRLRSVTLIQMYRSQGEKGVYGAGPVGSSNTESPLDVVHGFNGIAQVPIYLRNTGQGGQLLGTISEGYPFCECFPVFLQRGTLRSGTILRKEKFCFRG